MRFVRITVVVVACLGIAGSAASAAPARFWISDSKDDPTVPEAPTINAAVGRQRTLYIWAQPATDGGGAFRTLQNLSLDVVTHSAPMVPEASPFIDFLDGTFKVYNDPVINGDPRFQFTTDSFRIEDQGGPLLSNRSATQVMSGQPDGITGLQGVSLLFDDVVGLGHVSDPYRVMTVNGPAWRVAEFGFKALQSTGTNTLFLQIGHAGMLHQGAGGNDVVFGTNSMPIYNASNTSHRQKNLAGDTFDIQINAVEFTSGDFNGDGNVGTEDYLDWSLSFGQSLVPGEGVDGNADGVADAADYVLWRKLVAIPGSGGAAIGSAGFLQTNIVPEPGAGMLVLNLVVTILLFKRLRFATITAA